MASSLFSVFAYQPLKAVYVLLASLSVFVRLPFWLLYLIPRTLRQHSGYTLRQAAAIQLLKTVLYHTCQVYEHPAWTLKPGAEKERFERIVPSQKNVYKAVLDDPEIKPIEVGGTWYPTRYNPNEEKRKAVILHFHGGAFVVGDGRDKDFGYGAGLLTSHTNVWVFGLQYRLSSNPGGRFPAALQDAVTAYQNLLDRGIPPSSIVVSGDSAGGNLAIALLRYIKGNPGILPKPRAALLWAPWVNPGRAMRPYACSKNRNYKTDILVDDFLEWGVRTYAPPPIDSADPYVSPMDHPFKCGGIPIWVQFGELEILADDIVTFATGMRKIEGNEIEIHEDKTVPHDILLIGGALGFGDKAEAMAATMGEWLKKKL